MAIKVKDASASAQKFVTRASAAGGDYQKGVQGAGDTWQSKAAASGDAYAAGVQAGIGRSAFQKGIAKSGSAKYVARASGVGAQRYPQGIQGAGPTWQQNTQPYLDTIAGLTLPPKHPRGDPGNLQRVGMIAAALRARKIGS